MSAEIQQAMVDLGWNLSEFSRAVGVHRRTVGRWAAGEVEVPVMVQRMLWLLTRLHPDDRAAFLDKFGGLS